MEWKQKQKLEFFWLKAVVGPRIPPPTAPTTQEYPFFLTPPLIERANSQ